MTQARYSTQKRKPEYDGDKRVDVIDVTADKVVSTEMDAGYANSLARQLNRPDSAAQRLLKAGKL